MSSNVARRLGLLVRLQVVACVVVPLAGAAPGPAAPPLSTLLARHVPILVLHPAEQFSPVPVEGFIADSDVQRRTASGVWETVPGPPPPGAPDHRLDQRLCRALDGPAASSCYAQAEGAHRAGPVVYGAAFRRGKRIELQYWIWYPFNPYSTGVAPNDFWQAHEGDWEAVGVITDGGGRPLVAGYSQHNEGQRRAWARVPRRGPRPIVYVALGSHANFFTPGVHRFDPRAIEPLLITIIEQAGLQPVDRTGRGRTVLPRLVRVTATTPQWMAFAGTWGEDQFVRAPGGVAQAFGGGPRSPAFQEHWRRPVRDVLGWPRG